MANAVAGSAPAPTLLAGTSGALLAAPKPTLVAALSWPGDGLLSSVAASAPVPRLSASGTAGVAGSAALIAPAPSLVAVLINPAIISVVLTAPPARLVATLVRGNTLTAALTAGAPVLVATGYPAYTLTAALTAPRPYLVSSLSAPTIDAFLTLVLNTRKGALTAYDGFTFNSYCVFGGVVLGANASGVSVLAAQDDDAGTDIDAVVRTGAESFSSSYLKRVPRIYTSGSASGDLLFRTITAEGGTRTYALPFNGSTALQQRRVPVGRGPKSRFFSFEIANVAGSDFQINDVMVYPIALRRRVQ